MEKSITYFTNICQFSHIFTKKNRRKAVSTPKNPTQTAKKQIKPHFFHQHRPGTVALLSYKNIFSK